MSFETNHFQDQRVGYCAGIRRISPELPPKAAGRKNRVCDVIPPRLALLTRSKYHETLPFLFQNLPNLPAPDLLIPVQTTKFSLIPVDSQNTPHPPTPPRPEHPWNTKFYGIMSYGSSLLVFFFLRFLESITGLPNVLRNRKH